jgi:ammonium transporter, Amt family
MTDIYSPNMSATAAISATSCTPFAGNKHSLIRFTRVAALAVSLLCCGAATAQTAAPAAPSTQPAWHSDAVNTLLNKPKTQASSGSSAAPATAIAVPNPAQANASEVAPAVAVVTAVSSPKAAPASNLAPATPAVETDLSKISAQLAENTLNTELLILVFAGALVFFMQLGFAFLESGMSRSKNTVNVLMKNFCDLCFGSVVFWLVGYGIMYGTNSTGWFGMDTFAPAHLGAKESGILFFQIMFAAAAATIVSGAIAERTRFYGYIIGSVVICGFIYPVVGAWIWGSNHGGQGWLRAMGFVDFAGSTVVHSVGGWCALAALLVVKPRLGRYAPDGTPRLIQGHSMSNTLLGGLVLWVGWFGFNAGSVVSITGGNLADMGKIALATHLAGCAGALGAMLSLTLMKQRAMLSVTINGAISGMVAITAGSAVIGPHWAMLVGLIAGMLTSFAQPWIDKRGIDDVVGAVSVHLVGGIWGTLAVGLFGASTFMSAQQLMVQALGVLAVGVFTFTTAYAMYRLIDSLMGMRVSPLEEQRGLDISEHAEVGYPEFQGIMLHTGAAAAQGQKQS